MPILTLGMYNNGLFNEKVASLGVEESRLDRVSKWWLTLEEKREWVARFKKALIALPSSPEKKDAEAAFRGCEKRFNAINSMLLALLNRQVTSSNFFVRYWVEPLLDAVRDRPEIKAFNSLAEEIELWMDDFWTDEMDQILAVIEVIVEYPGVKNLELIRLLVAQWTFQEIVRLLPREELHYLFGALPAQSTIDPFEMERMELFEAVRSYPWSEEQIAFYRLIYNDLRKAMDLLDFETQGKIDFTDALNYALGEIGRTVSAMAILRNGEAAWKSVRHDSTLKDFWTFQQEELEEEADEEE